MSKTSLSDIIFVSLTLFCVGYFFVDICVLGEYGGFEYAVSELIYVWAFIIPAVFTGIKADGTVRSIIRPFLLVLPAFVLMLICPVVLWIFGSIYFAPAYTSVLSLFLFTCVLFAVCNFVFRISSSEITGLAVCEFFVLLFIYGSIFYEILDEVKLFFISSFLILLLCLFIVSHTVSLRHTLVFASSAEICLALACSNADSDFSVVSAVYSLQNGIFDLRSVLKLLSVSAFFILLSKYISDIIKHKKQLYEFPIKKTCIYFIFLLTLIVSNIAVRALPERFTVIDASGYDIYSIPKSARKYLSSLEKDVIIYKVSDGEDNLIVDTLVSAVSSFSGKISVHEINSHERPYFWAKYSDKEYENNSLIVVSGDKYIAIPLSEILIGDEDGNYRFDGKSALLSAIVSVSLDRAPSVKLLELSEDTLPQDSFLEAMEKTGASVSALSADEEIACDLLILATDGTDADISRTEEIISYINSGGKVILIVSGKDLPNISYVSEYCGITVDTSGTVLDDYKYVYSPIYTVLQPSEHEICDPIDANSVIYPAPHALSLKEANGFAVSPLLVTSEQGYVYSEGEGEDFTRSEYGVYTTAAIAENSKGGCLICYTSPDIFCEDFDILGKSCALFLSTVSYLCDIPYTVNLAEIELALPAVCINNPEQQIIAASYLIFIPAVPLCIYILRRFSDKGKAVC